VFDQEFITGKYIFSNLEGNKS